MKNFRFAVIAALAVTVLSLSAAAQTGGAAPQPAAGGTIPDGKVVVINTTVFPAQVLELKQKYEQVDGKFKDRFQKLEGMKQEITKLTNELNAQANVLPEDKKREKTDSIELLTRQGKRDQEDLNADVEKELETATKPVRDKLFQSLSNYAAKHNIVMVLSLAGAAQSGTLAFWNPSSDITDEFVKEYNRANPVAGGAPATTPAATPGAKPPVKPSGNQ